MNKTANSKYRLRLYQRLSSIFVFKIFWVMAFIQFPLGSILSYFGMMSRPPLTYLTNGLLLFIASIIFYYIIVKKNYNPNFMKYIMQIFFLFASWISIYSYHNDIYMKVIWAFPIILSMIYFDKFVTVATLIASLIGLVSLDIIQPVFVFQQPTIHYYGTSIVLNFALLSTVYFVFNWVYSIKFGIDNTIEVISEGLSFITHSIKNEFTLINYYINNQDVDKILINESINHINSLTEKLLKYVSTTSTLMKEDCSLNEIIDECIKITELKINKTNKKIIIKKNYSSSFNLNCDPVHIKEVLINLFNNSIEAIENYGFILVNIKITHLYIKIEIIDNGVGISEKNLPQVVDPFFSTKKRTTNNGIGLTYCNSIIEQHEGFLDIYSKKNIGTTVILNFKREQKEKNKFFNFKKK